MTTVLPAWKKELIEKKKKKEREEKQKLQEEAARIDQIPEWKRALLQKRCAQTTSVAARPQQTSSSQNVLNGNSSSHTKGGWSPPASSLYHSEGSHYVIEYTSSPEKPSTNKHHSDGTQDKISPKESINNGEINSFVTTFVDPCKEDNSLPIKELTVISNSEMEEDVYSKPTDNAVNGLNHADIKIYCESKENLTRTSDNVDYEHVRPPSEIRKLFEKPKVQIVSEDDKSEKSNERITGYTNGKLNKDSDNFKTRDVHVDRSAQEIDQKRFKSSSDNRKLIKQKLPDSKADVFSTGIDDSQISAKTKNAPTSTAGKLASSTVGSYTKLCASPFTPTSNNSFKPSSQFPRKKSSFVEEKSKDVIFQSQEKKKCSEQKHSDINKSGCEGTKDVFSPQNLTPYPVQNFEKEKQDNKAILKTQSSSSVQNSIILAGNGETKFESRDDNMSDPVEKSAHVEEKLNDSQKVDDVQLNHTKSNEKHTSTPYAVSQPTKHSGKGQEMCRPPRLQKRWSADVATMLFLQKSNEELRYRSPSISEIAEENMDWSYLFRHRPSVSEGIERRMSKLKRQVSHSEEEENEETTQQLEPVEGDDNSSQQRQQKTTRARPASWHAPEDFVFNTEKSSSVIATQVPRPRVGSDVIVPFAHKQSVSESIERRVGELVRHSSTPDLFATIIDSDKESWSSVESSPEFKKGKESEKSKNSKEVVSDIENEENEEKDFEANAKPSKGSVHKLSALFGSSIFKSNKKEKSKNEPKTGVIKPPKNEKVEKEIKNKNSMKAKEENKTSPSFFRKVFKNENKTAKARTNENGIKADVHTVKLKTKDVTKPTSTDNGPSSFPAKLRHVSGQEKRKVKKTIGMMVIMVDEDAEDVKPNSKQSNSWLKSSSPAQVVDTEKSKIFNQMSVPQVNRKEILSDNNSSTPDLFKTKEAVNPTHHSPDYQTSSNAEILKTASNDISVSVIDMPDPSKSDVEVSVIDIPRSPTLPDVEVSAIDLPESPDAPEISVIDMPEPETKTQNRSWHQVQVFDISDGSDDSDSDDERTGSYDITTVIDGEDSEPFAIIEGESFRNDIDERDQDDAQLATVPVVIFENALPSNLISSMCHNRRRKKVSLF